MVQNQEQLRSPNMKHYRDNIKNKNDYELENA